MPSAKEKKLKKLAIKLGMSVEELKSLQGNAKVALKTLRVSMKAPVGRLRRRGFSAVDAASMATILQFQKLIGREAFGELDVETNWYSKTPPRTPTDPPAAQPT